MKAKGPSLTSALVFAGEERPVAQRPGPEVKTAKHAMSRRTVHVFTCLHVLPVLEVLPVFDVLPLFEVLPVFVCS